jgi:predicted amino acid racemase
VTAPRIEIDLNKIRSNTRLLVERLGRRGIGVTGVTKAVCGRPDIARAMLDGGVTGLADARIENVERMRRSGITRPISLIRTPMLSQANRITQGCDTSYNTEMDAIHMLASSASRANTVHGVILMVEMGDLREGIMPGDLCDFTRKAMDISGVTLKGIGANFACLNGAPPDPRDMAKLSSLATRIEATCGFSLETVSGGNSASLPWAFGGGNTGRINDLRLGEAILLGVEPVSGRRIDGLHTDAFTVVAEVIESNVKPAGGDCRALEPGAGLISKLSDRRRIRQSILAIGNQDTDIDGLSLPPGVTQIGATSDHLVVETASAGLAIGTEVALQLNYGALMRIMNAPNIEKVTLHPAEARELVSRQTQREENHLDPARRRSDYRSCGHAALPSSQ